MQAVDLEVFYRVNIPLDVDENPELYPLRKIARVNYHSVPCLGDISSTNIRKAILSPSDRYFHSLDRFIVRTTSFSFQNIPIVNQIVPTTLSKLYPDVLDYIIDKKLYGFSQSTKASTIQFNMVFLSFGMLLAWQFMSHRKR